MGASHPFLEFVQRLELELDSFPRMLLPLKFREEDRARDPVVGNISLHLFISEHTAQERNHLFHGFEYCVRERTRSSL
jgi:hypothetical protein